MAAVASAVVQRMLVCPRPIGAGWLQLPAVQPAAACACMHARVGAGAAATTQPLSLGCPGCVLSARLGRRLLPVPVAGCV